MSQLILFDIDGTLLKPGDTAHQQALLDAITRTYGIEASLDGVPLGGMLDAQIVRLTLEKYAVPPDDVRDGLADVMDNMGQRYLELLDGDDRRSWLLPGVEDLILRTRSEYTLSVLTGNASGVARAKLAAAGIDQYFASGAYGDSAEHRFELVAVAIGRAAEQTGEAVQPSKTVLVGDTPRDIEAAKESGARVLAVATGRYSMNDLAGHGPDLIFSDLGDTDSVYQAIHELMST